MGLKEICFTPHFEFDPVRTHLDGFTRINGQSVSMFGNWIEIYCRDVQDAKNRFKPLGLEVKLGVEIGYDLGLEGAIAAVVDEYPFDYVLGSVHCVDHLALSSESEYSCCFEGKTLEELTAKYFNTLAEGIKSGLFDVIGHLDLYRRYGIRYYGEGVSSAHIGHVETILNLAAQKGIGLEVNTSSVNQGLAEFYPCRDILEKAISCGVKVFTTGSDTHRIGTLGRGVEQAKKLLKELGAGLSTFEKRRAKSL